MNKNQKGFTGVEVLLVVLILAVVGFGGYYVYNNQHKTKSTTPNSTPNTTFSQVQPSNLTLGQAVTHTDNVYSAYEKEVLDGQVLKDSSQWAHSNVAAAEDLQFINNHKTWFTQDYILWASNYETANTTPPGDGFLTCVSGIAYYNNGSTKANGGNLNNQTAKVTLTYTTGSTGSAATGGQTTHSVPVTLKPSSGAWAIDAIDLSGC